MVFREEASAGQQRQSSMFRRAGTDVEKVEVGGSSKVPKAERIEKRRGCAVIMPTCPHTPHRAVQERRHREGKMEIRKRRRRKKCIGDLTSGIESDAKPLKLMDWTDMDMPRLPTHKFTC